MHEHLKEIAWSLDCDKSARAAAGIVRRAPRSRRELEGRLFRRELSRRERGFSSTLREMLGYAHTVKSLVASGVLRRGELIEIVGDSKVAAVIFAKGGSQANYDPDADELLLLEVLLDILAAVASAGCEARFRWVRRNELQGADDLSKYEDSHDFGLKPWAMRRVGSRLGPWDIDRFAAPHNAICARFNSMFHSHLAEAADAFAQSWAHGVSFILPEFSEGFICRVLDKIEADNAAVVCIVPHWPAKRFWRRLHCTAWRERIARSVTLPSRVLAPHDANAQFCFFGASFDSPLLAFRTRSIAP